MEIAVGKFKVHCLELLREVQTRHKELILTKRGRPVAKVVPIEEEPPADILGCMKGKGRITGDIVGPIGVKWDADA